MWLPFKQSNRKIANLIIKDHVIRYIEIKSQQPLVIAKYGERLLPEGIIKDGKIVSEEMLEMILEQCIHSWKIRKQRVRFLVPDPAIMIRRLTVPAHLKGEEIRGYLYMELGETIPLPFAVPVFDFAALGQVSEEEQEILLFAAPEQGVLQYTKLLEKLRLKPIAADISPLSAYRFLYAFGDINPKEHSLLIQCDLTSINATVFHEHYPLFNRQLNVEMNTDKWRQVQIGATQKFYYKWDGTEEELHLQFEDIVKEVDRVMSFYRFSFQGGEQEINRIFVIGDHPFFQHIYKRMATRFSIPVEHIDDEVAVSLGDPLDRSYYLPLGLALKEVR